MNKQLTVLLISFIFCTASFSQKLSVVVNYVTNDGTTNNGIINYEPDQLLSWSDFKGKPVLGTEAAALTSAGFGVKLSFRRSQNASQLIISVSCSFSRKDSWVVPANKTPYILNHEQKHFDIAYIHTLLFIEKLKNAGFTNTNYGAVIEKIYNETAQTMSDVQNNYDAETSHSRVPEKQAAWDKKISEQLETVVSNFRKG